MIGILVLFSSSNSLANQLMSKKGGFFSFFSGYREKDVDDDIESIDKRDSQGMIPQQKVDELIKEVTNNLAIIHCDEMSALRNELNLEKQKHDQTKQKLKQQEENIKQLKLQVDSLKNQIARLKGELLSDLKVNELVDLQKTLQNTLLRINEKLKDKILDLGDEDLCLICWERKKDVFLEPCHHLCLCACCVKEQTIITCPLCRKPVTDKKRIKHSS